MQRRTKIVATLGPSTSSPEQVAALITAGVNVVRMNFSHGCAQDHIDRTRVVREEAAKQGRFVAILGDLQGPKIRISRFTNGKEILEVGQNFILDAELDGNAGNQQMVGIDYKELVTDSQPGDILLLDDGRLVFEVTSVTGQQIHCSVIVGGTISNNKGINRKGGGLSAAALTEKDKQDILLAAELDVDYLAVSFPRDAADMQHARELMQKANCDANLIAKIERAEAVEDDILDGIIQACDGVMVARGDLGVEIGDAELIGVQKHIIERARTFNKVVITATQMMESMISSPLPTRAEVFDVANAVLDGTDAVMLSGETAMGDYPIQTVEAMARVIVGAEQHPSSNISQHRMHESFTYIDESVALSSMYVANHLEGVKAIICMTETGATPLIMSRIRSQQPIYAYCRLTKTQNRVSMYRGVKTIPFDVNAVPHAEINQRAVDELVQREVVTEGDLVIITKGDYVNAQGGTNTMKIVKVGAKIQ